MKFLLVIALLATSALAQQSETRKTPLVLIKGNGDVTVAAGGVAVGGVAVGSATESKHDQTMEMAQELLKHCPEITLTIGTDQPADYALLLNRESAGWLNSGLSQFMLVRGSDKSVLYVNKKGTVAKAMKDACKSIMDDWKQQHETARPAGTGWWTPTPKKP